MVSIDHFRHELLAQMSRAATQGRIDILVNSGELCRSLGKGDLQMFKCCDAMLCSKKLKLAMFYLSNAPTARE